MKYLQIKTDAQGTLDDVQVKRAEADKNGNDISETYAHFQNEDGGFNAGLDSSADAGSASGNQASVQGGGGAVGSYAESTGGGGAVGNHTTAMNGSGAVGYYATAVSQGFAGGYQAISEGTGAVQLGTGSNTTANTLQFRSYPLVDANGHIPADRLDGTYDISVSYATQANSAGTATTAATATQATRAIGDGNGNNIINTYAKKAEIPTLKYQHNIQLSFTNSSLVFSVILPESSSYYGKSIYTLVSACYGAYNNAGINAGGYINNNAPITSIWFANSSAIGINRISSNGGTIEGSQYGANSFSILRDQVIPVGN